MTIFLTIVAIFALWLYIEHQKDVYFVYGSIIALYYSDYADIVLERNLDTLYVITNNGWSTDMYSGIVAKDIIRALKKNDIEVIERRR